MTNTEPVRVTIFNQSYSLLASEEAGRIEQLAHQVDDLMSSIAARAGNVDATRTAVLACLHLADQLNSVEGQLSELKQKLEHKAQELRVLLDGAIDPESESAAHVR